MNHLPDNLRFLRKQTAKRQEDIGLLVGKGQTTIGNWESGKSEPNIEELLILSNFFAISVDNMLKVNLAKTNDSQAAGSRMEEQSALPADKGRYKYNKPETLVEEEESTGLTRLFLEIKLLKEEFGQLKTAIEKKPLASKKIARKQIPGNKSERKTG